MASATSSQTQRPGKFGLWLWMGAGAFFLVGSLTMIGLMLMSGQDMRSRSLNMAKRIEFTPDFSKVDGRLLRAADLEKNFQLDDSKPAAEPEVKTDEHSQEPAPEAPVAEPAPQPAAEKKPAEPAAHEEDAHAEPAPPAEAPAEETHPAEVSHPVEPQPTPAPTAEPAPTPAPAAETALAPVQKKTDLGILPIIAPDGTQPWQYFAKQAPASASGKPRIAIVLYGLGQARLATEAALALPAGVTLSFSPYSRQLDEWSQRANSAGHEIMLDLPMETASYPAMDPGPYGLLNSLSTNDNYQRLQSVMARATGYVGLLMPLKEAISSNATAITGLVQAMQKHGLILLGSESNTAMPFSDASIHATSPILHADIVLDARIQENYIQAQLAQLEQLAQKQGFALAIGRSFPVTVEQVADWASQAASKGFVLVPVSALAPSTSTDSH